ncbi:MAG: dTDP-4-amino-4,6-dideoxygalactose transaminase [Brevundimonas sp.]|jgi:dTDP-4-amino-4,6-dideoxygalactose transaminase|uniref:DegT/DnrJ/EryC1/StrS family aminotransferase n=1 Tax=Brevundimonas sp. TaxID=1871086 RepID=UPI0039E23033
MIPLSAPEVGAREQALVAQALAAGDVAMGPQVAAFETAFAALTGRAYALAVSSGTAALHLALRLLNLKPGEAVICPTLTFMGGVAPVIYQGATPIFADVDPVTWGLDPACLPEAFDAARARGLTVRAVVPADLYGQCCDIGPILDIAADRGVPVILDSAEAVGATLNGRHAGAGALMAAYSFNGNKIITTGGGGMLVSDDAALMERARYLSTAARRPAVHYEHDEVGYNYRLGAVAAAIGLAQMETLETRVARRRAIFETYQTALSGLPGVSFAPGGPGRKHTRWLSVMLLGDEARITPDALRQTLHAEGIESRPVWKPMHLQPVFRDAPRVAGAVAESLFAQGLCLPSSTTLTEPDQARIIDIIRARLA